MTDEAVVTDEIVVIGVTGETAATSDTIMGSIYKCSFKLNYDFCVMDNHRVYYCVTDNILHISWVWQEWLGLNPCCKGIKRFCDVKCDIIW